VCHLSGICETSMGRVEESNPDIVQWLYLQPTWSDAEAVFLMCI
jgi:hypothetical protein